MKLGDVAAGSVLVADGGFTCIRANTHCTVKTDDNGLYVNCDAGKHYLNGQTDFATGAQLVGLSLKSANHQ